MDPFFQNPPYFLYVFPPNSHSLTGLFLPFFKLCLKFRFFVRKNTSNPNIKSNFGNFSINFGQFSELNRFYNQKVQKKSMSKNGVKAALRPLFKELKAILGFSKISNRIYQFKLKKWISRFLALKSNLLIKVRFCSIFCAKIHLRSKLH